MQWKDKIIRGYQRVLGTLDDYPSLQTVPYWIAAIAVGFIAVGYTSLFHLFSEITQRAVEQYRFWMIAPVSVVLCGSWWVVRKFAFLAAGSGIPQVIAALELSPENYDRKLNYLLGLKTVAIKLVSSLGLALGGAAVGPEGPTIQICAGIFHSIGKRFQKIWPQIGHESLILAGGAAGVAAAFNTPLGGIVFAVEELSHRHFHKVKTVLISAVIIAGLVAQWVKGPYLMLEFPMLKSTGNLLFFWAIAMGIITGILGGAFSKLSVWGASQFFRLGVKEKVLFNIWLGCSLVVFAVYFGTEVLGSGLPYLADLLKSPEKDIPWTSVFGRLVFPLFSYVAGGAAGLMAPALAAGGVLGRQFNEVFVLGYPNLMVLLGMIGFLAALTRAPFTAFVLVLEMTDRHSAIFFMMMTALVASAVSKTWGGKSLYEDRKDFYINLVNQAASASR